MATLQDIFKLVNEDTFPKFVITAKDLCRVLKVKFEFVDAALFYFDGYNAAIVATICKAPNITPLNFQLEYDAAISQKELSFVFSVEELIKNLPDVDGNMDVGEYFKHICNTFHLSPLQIRMSEFYIIKEYCFKAYKVNKNAFTNKMFEIAWSRGHGYGYSDVVGNFSDLTDLYDIYNRKTDFPYLYLGEQCSIATFMDDTGESIDYNFEHLFTYNHDDIIILFKQTKNLFERFVIEKLFL